VHTEMRRPSSFLLEPVPDGNLKIIGPSAKGIAEPGGFHNGSRAYAEANAGSGMVAGTLSDRVERPNFEEVYNLLRKKGFGHAYKSLHEKRSSIRIVAPLPLSLPWFYLLSF
jgi:hypothetical protein